MKIRATGPRPPKTKVTTADICVFVEGTYPYVTGGASAWLHTLITHLPEFTFSLLHLGSQLEPGRSFKYQLPPNVVDFQEVFLSHSSSLGRPSRFPRAPGRWRSLQAFHDTLVQGKCEA